MSHLRPECPFTWGSAKRRNLWSGWKRGYEDRDPVYWWIKSDQLYDSIRNEPRFQALLKKLGPDQ
jgi:hypothetical protein